MEASTKNINQKTIAIVAGKSGGHIIPALTIAKKYATSFIFFSTNSKLDHTILNTENITLITLKTSRRTKIFFDLFLLTHACIKSFYYLMRYKPLKIVSTGGLVSIPVCIAATILRIPIILYELNAIPGKATTMLAPCATNIYHCFITKHGFFSKTKCRYKPYPIQFSATEKISRHRARAALHLDTTRTTLLILGGSQGSQFINRLIKQWIIQTMPSNIQILHQIGLHEERAAWNTFYAEQHIAASVFQFQNNLHLLYCAADMIVCRAGAGTLFETIFFKRPALIIPLMTKTTHHQQANAYNLQQKYPHLFTVFNQHEIEENPALIHHVLDDFFLPGQLSGVLPKVNT